MKRITNPIEKIGSLHIKPNWRFEALQNPARYKMQEFISPATSNSGALKRFIRAGLSYEVNYKVPPSVVGYMSALGPNQAKLLLRLWSRAFKRSRQKKISIDTDRQIFQSNPVWNLNLVESINDEFLKRLIYHHSNFKYDRYIAKAIEYSKSEEHGEIFRFMGYCMYAKVSDGQIAKRWTLPLKHVEAIRMLFYDFSHFPKDRMANFSYLRQLTNIGLFSDVDFAYYKRVFELGELGLKAQTDFYNLDAGEKKVISEYLGKSIIANTLNIQFSIKNQKDALNYGQVVTNLASYYIKESEMTYFAAKTRNLDACTRRIEGELTDSTKGMTSLDKELLAMLKEHSLQDSRVSEYKTLEML